jgi:hypothetical protein
VIHKLLMANHIGGSHNNVSSYDQEDFEANNIQPIGVAMRSENVGEADEKILSPMIEQESQSMLIGRSISFDGLKKKHAKSRFKIKGPSSESSDDNHAKWRKVDKML